MYLFFTDFQILKKIFGDSLPIATSTPPVGPSGEVDFLTHSQDLSISVFASGLTGPRVIAFDSRGRMLVSETKAGRVVLLEDIDKDGLAETKTVLREDLRSPHGLAFYTDPKTKKVYLYIAETHQVSRFEYDTSKGIITSATGKNIAGLPADGRHFARTIGFGPNYRPVPILGGASTIDTQVKDKLYISVGSSCDACVEMETWKRAAILESDSEGNYTAEFAGGLRSAEFFTFHPETKEIWASETGRDGLGANLPPDEINIIKVATSEHQYGARRYGWPFCYGNQVKDSTFQPDKVDRIDIPTDCGQSEPATIE
ncbi:MAG: PQQ-dependent sugar dehydrogenase, partial [bacterium]|nr:PQQ-dependent sugar dehydrogenase [bacterium]